MNCNDCKNFEPKVIKPDNSLKLHSTCKHEACALENEPCKSCWGKSSKPRWEPKEPDQPRLPKIGDWVEANVNKDNGGIVKGEKYQVIAPDDPDRGDWVYVRSPEKSSLCGDGTSIKIKQPFAYLHPNQYTLLPDYQPKPKEPITTYRGKLYREVKRKANVGELVKIVKATETKGHYKNGDIIQVVKWGNSDTWAYYRQAGGHFLRDSEYVVLEPIEVKRAYTAEQIREARDIVYREMIDRVRTPIAVNYDEDTKTATARMFDTDCKGKILLVGKETAKCSDNDTPNKDVGMMVAICKLTGEKLPKWVKGERE